MNWQDLCCMCCGDMQAFWDKLARQLQRYRYCANGECSEDPLHQIPGQDRDQMDSDTFLLVGFMALPLLFFLFSMFQRMSSQQRALPPGKPSRNGSNNDEGPPMPPVD
uniref:Small integral membrane protein 14 n=1 Tax=Hanusia phi TaxID=3032 RepID=A0A7S0EYC9_9CRYP|mmetsp:Transcript_33365/g.74803  ORF Transcript_33365/g.74803 Transcript_33365/m.74803 type:complete len:108 (+) Transcript_33365:304-627(+)